MSEPPPMPPQQAKKPERPRTFPVLKPAVRVITARTTRSQLSPVEKPIPNEVDNGG